MKKILFLVLGLCIIIVGYLKLQHYENKSMNSSYQIIYLNGPSSVGKSTLARALQNKLKDPFLFVGIDQIIFMMPEKMNDWHHETLASGFSWQPVKDQQGNIEAYKIHVGPYGKKMVQNLKDMVVALARAGNHIIIDDVSFGKQKVDAWKEELKNFKVLWVGLTAPLEVIEQREQQRGDRKLHSGRWQAEHVHVGVEYDLMLDTHAHSLEENITQVMHKLNQD